MIFARKTVHFIGKAMHTNLIWQSWSEYDRSPLEQFLQQRAIMGEMHEYVIEDRGASF